VDTNLLTEARLSAAVCKRSIYLKTLIAMANITLRLNDQIESKQRVKDYEKDCD